MSTQSPIGSFGLEYRKEMRIAWQIPEQAIGIFFLLIENTDPAQLLQKHSITIDYFSFCGE